ncbi:MAG TPA: FtsX-like permease family protein [Gammaproteobacteria bacterium]
MTRLLLRASRRFFLRHPWQLALAIAGVALGVAVYVGVTLANDSARRAFELSSQAVLGRTTHRLLPVGRGLPEEVFAELVRSGVTHAAPVVETDFALRDAPGRRFRMLGVDPIEEPNVRGLVGLVPGASGAAARLIAEPGTVLLPESLAERLGAAPDTELEILVGGRPRTIVVAGTLRETGGDAEPPVVADIATVQALTGTYGVIDRIDLRLSEEEARRLAAEPPAGTTLVAAGTNEGFDQLARAFRTNLAALGLLALVVGMFLIYSTMSFAIVQRRAVYGALLAIGLDRRRLLGNVLAEAAAIGAIATGAGLLLGHWLARGLVDLVLATIGDFYFSAAVSDAAPSPWIYARGAALGVAATLVSALGPAVDASRVSPDAAMRRAALERRSRQRARRAAGLAIPALALAGAALSVDSRSLYLAFAALFFVLLAGALVTPAATSMLMRAVEPAAARVFGLPGRLAVRGVTASLSRTGVAAAALAVAVATVVGIGLMIGSFRASLVDWLGETLTADLYVSLGAASLDADGVNAIRALPGVTGVSVAQFALLPTPQGPVSLRAASPGPEGWGLDIVAGDDEALLEARPSVAVSEPFAFRHGLGVGDRLTLPTPHGPRAFEIVAVYRDYNAGGSGAMMSIGHYREIWEDDEIATLGVHIADDADAGRVRDEVAALLPDGAARMRSTAGLVEISLEIFDRTFRITEVLRILAAVVAFLGVLSALLSIQLEKAREHAVLRAVGFAPRQLGTLMLTQTTLLGVSAGLAALPIGAALAALLVHVINRRSFGWTMDLVVLPEPLLAGLALAVGAAFLAGVYPALRMRRADLAAALREE